MSIFGSFNVMTFRRRVKSPEVVETTFTMSTIEEEMEGVNIGQTSSQEILAGSTSTTN